MAPPRPAPTYATRSGVAYMTAANLPLPLPVLVCLLFVGAFIFLYLMSRCFRYDRVRALTRKERQLIAKTIPSDKNDLPPFRFVTVRRLICRHTQRRLAIIPPGVLLRGPPAGSTFAPFGEYGWMVFDFLAAAQVYQNGDPATLEEALRGLGPVRKFIAEYLQGERYWNNCGKIGPVFWVEVTPGKDASEPKSEEEKGPRQFMAQGGERYLLKTRYGSLTFEYSKEKKKFLHVG